MRIDRGLLYALAAAVALAEAQIEASRDASRRPHPQARDGGSRSAMALAIQTGVPVEYLRKILRRLARAGVITATRGASGGFRLARGAAAVTVLDVFQAVDSATEPDPFVDLARPRGLAPAQRTVAGWHEDWSRATRKLLAKCSLAELAAQSR